MYFEVCMTIIITLLTRFLLSVSNVTLIMAKRCHTARIIHHSAGVIVQTATFSLSTMVVSQLRPYQRFAGKRGQYLSSTADNMH